MGLIPSQAGWCRQSLRDLVVLHVQHLLRDSLIHFLWARENEWRMKPLSESRACVVQSLGSGNVRVTFYRSFGIGEGQQGAHNTLPGRPPSKKRQTKTEERAEGTGVTLVIEGKRVSTFVMRMFHHLFQV
jgi:hypothetical protein